MKTTLGIIVIGLQIICYGNVLQAQRISLNTGFGLVKSKTLYHQYNSVYYPSVSISMNIMNNKYHISTARLSYGKWHYCDEDAESWSFFELSALTGLIKEKKWYKIYGMAGIGYSHHHYWTEYPQAGKPYDIKKLGLAYETGITFIPLSSFGLGVKFNGHLTTDGWSSYGLFLVFDFGMLRK